MKAFGHIGGAIIGPISLKLATARNEVAGAAGVAGLAILGVASTGRVQDIVEALINPDIVLVDGQRYGHDEIVRPSFGPDFPYELKEDEPFMFEQKEMEEEIKERLSVAN